MKAAVKILAILLLAFAPLARAAIIDDSNPLYIPAVGDNTLRILNGTTLELVQVVGKNENATMPWNFVTMGSGAGNTFVAPDTTKITVSVGGVSNAIAGVLFKRNVIYAPLFPDSVSQDLRAEAHLYLILSNVIADGSSVVVTNPDQSIWTNTMIFSATKSATRFSPVIHICTAGYQLGSNTLNGSNWLKQAVVHQYRGNSATPGAINSEMDLTNSTTFQLIRDSDSSVVYSNNLVTTIDTNNLTPAQYQLAKVADFTAYTPAATSAPSLYHLKIPDLGVSRSFPIADWVFMNHARTYELGLYNQRCGVAVVKPYSRHTHVACHLQAVIIPDNTNGVWTDIAANSSPSATSKAACYFPSVLTGTISAYGAHHDAGDYGLYTFDVADLISKLVNGVDSLGLGSYDNLGIPESGDGKSDLLQEAKWAADYLVAMQDSDGGIWSLQRPVTRSFESNVGLQSSGDAGDQRQVWPKNIGITASAAGALAEIGSSPTFITQFGATTASNYIHAATNAWKFITNGITTYGSLNASYQKIYSSNFSNDLDMLTYCAASLYAATGNTNYANQLFTWCPDPSTAAGINGLNGSAGSRPMSYFYGSAIRVWCFMEASGKQASGAQTFNSTASTWNTKALAHMAAAAMQRVSEIQSGPWGIDLEQNNKTTFQGGYEFALQYAYDIAYGYAKSPAQNYLDAFTACLSYVGGVNPDNMSVCTGLGLSWNVASVNQYHLNDKRRSGPTGQHIGHTTSQFADGLLAGLGYGLADSYSIIAEVVFPPYRTEVNSGTSVNNSMGYMEKDARFGTWNYGGDEWVTSQNGAPAVVAALWIAQQTAAATRSWVPH